MLLSRGEIMEVKIVKCGETKTLTLTNVVDKKVEISVLPHLFDVHINEPLIRICSSKNMGGIISPEDLDKLISGLYQVRAHYRKLGGRPNGKRKDSS